MDQLEGDLSLIDNITFKEILLDFSKDHPKECDLLNLLVAGWTLAEVARITGLQIMDGPNPML